MNSSKTKLECYEGSTKVCGTFHINIGKNGLRWGTENIIKANKTTDPLTYEGNKKVPAGIFQLTNIFGYSQKSPYSLPSLYADKKPTIMCR